MRRGMSRRTYPSALLVVLALGLGVPAGASADAGSAVIAQCFNTGSVSSTYSQAAYNEALSELDADAIEYSDCQQLIHQAQLAAAARAGQGGSTATGLSGAPSVPPTSFTPKERAAIASLASPKSGAAPVTVGGKVVRPGLVPVNLAAAVNTLPTPLVTLLAILAAAVLLAAGRLVLNRVGDRDSH